MAKEVKNKNNRHFLKDFKAELKKVIWPTPKQLINSTTAVITIVIITAAIVFVLDLAFKTVNEHGIDRLKSMVSNTTENNIDNSIGNTTSNTTENTDTNVSQENTTVEGNTVQNTTEPNSEENQVQE